MESDHDPDVLVFLAVGCSNLCNYWSAGIPGWKTEGAQTMTTAKPMLTNNQDRRFVRRFCELFIQKLRALLKKNHPKESPCSSCAFAPTTDSWEGFDSTCWHMMQALMHKRPFYCHRNMETVNGEYKPDPSNLIPCAGYEAVRNCPEALDAIRDAAIESEPIRRTQGRSAANE